MLSPTTGLVALAAAGLVTLVTSGVGALGPGTDETTRITTTENAANGAVGSLRVDDVRVVAVPGGAAVRVALANDGTAPDRLVAVTVDPTDRSGALDAGSSGGRVADAAPTATARIAGTVALPAGSLTDLETGTPRLTLPGTRAVPGTMAAVTFRFADAGGLTLDAPVVAS